MTAISRRSLLGGAAALAPTVAALFGLPAPPGGWDGVALTPAFAGVPA
jgi:hypothetical protein